MTNMVLAYMVLAGQVYLTESPGGGVKRTGGRWGSKGMVTSVLSPYEFHCIGPVTISNIHYFVEVLLKKYERTRESEKG